MLYHEKNSFCVSGQYGNKQGCVLIVIVDSLTGEILSS